MILNYKYGIFFIISFLLILIPLSLFIEIDFESFVMVLLVAIGGQVFSITEEKKK